MSRNLPFWMNYGFFKNFDNLGIVNLAISGDTIAVISASELLGDSIINGNGKYIVPGLVNAQVHACEANMLKEPFDTEIITVLDYTILGEQVCRCVNIEIL